MGIKLTPTPVYVSQGTAPHCWAACITSWLALHKDRPQYSRQKLVNLYGNPKTGGGISFQDTKWGDLVRDLRIVNSSPVLIVGTLKPGPKNSQLTLVEFAETIENRLLSHGYLLLVDNHTPTTMARSGISHMYLISGIRDGSGGGYEILVMDPSPKKRKIISPAELRDHHIALFSSLERSAPNYVGW